MALWAAIPHTSTGNTTPSQPASGTNGRSQASVLGTTPDYWKPCAVARFRSVLGPPPGLIRDRDGSRESARSANLRAIGALGAAKRPPQLPQESRSRPARRDGVGRDRDRTHQNPRDRETVDDFVDARRSRRREHRRSHASPNALSRRGSLARTNQRSARTLVAVVCHCHPPWRAVDVVQPHRATRRSQHSHAPGMLTQPG